MGLTPPGRQSGKGRDKGDPSAKQHPAAGKARKRSRRQHHKQQHKQAAAGRANPQEQGQEQEKGQGGKASAAKGLTAPTPRTTRV